MRKIKKRSPPQAIVAFRNDTETSFDDFPYKDSVRAALTEEQGHLCCYCLKRIEANAVSMRIEHFEPQSVAPERRYDWGNLLGSCRGGQGGARVHQTCDTRKADKRMTVDPQGENVLRVRFSGEGVVHSSDPEIQRDLYETLNLNNLMLVAVRKQRLRATLDELAKQHRGSWTRATLVRVLGKWRPEVVTGRLPEYCEMVAQELERRLARA